MHLKAHTHTNVLAYESLIVMCCLKVGKYLSRYGQPVVFGCDRL